LRSLVILFFSLFLCSEYSFAEAPFAWTKRPRRPKMERHFSASSPIDGEVFHPLPITLKYEHDAPGLIPIKKLMQVPIELMRTAEGGYAHARDDQPVVSLTLDELNQHVSSTPLYASALKAISEALGQYAYKSGYIGYFFTISLEDAQNVHSKTRGSKEQVLTIEISTAFCGDVRTVVKDKKYDRPIVNGYRYNYIRNKSPVYAAHGEYKTTSILRKDHLDEYAIYLNRYPDRQVDVHIHPLDDPGMMSVDYMITPKRPWHIYLGAANTGTHTTGKWIESVGFIHTQAIATDATFRLDYSTADFGRFHSVRTYYDFNFFGLRRTRCRPHISYNYFSSSQLGYETSDFRGRQYLFGVLWDVNVHQRGRLFIDGVLDVRYRLISVNNIATGIDSRNVRFLTPRLGMAIEKSAYGSHFKADLGLNFAINGFAVGSRAGVQSLGRPQVDDSWWYFDGGFDYRLFLDAIKQKSKSPMAHEIHMRGMSQLAFGYRLIPQLQGVLGGMQTVRGYPEGMISGDSVLALTFEYLYHFPRKFKPNPNPRVKIFRRKFKAAPRFEGDRPDWDLAFKTFLDVGGSHSNRKLGEYDSQLVGAGVGGEVSFLDKLSLRMDLGVALRKAINANSVTGQPVDAVRPGHTRLHMSATFMY
jgi:hemolysin activation/secretion protein